MKRKSILALALCIIMSWMLIGCGKAKADKEDYQYYTADELKAAIENKVDIYLLDIQPTDDYKAHHIVGTIPTYAYPADTDKLTAKIDVALDEITKTNYPIIVVCPGGGSGAKNTINYLTSKKNIDPSRLFILENGQKGWPHDDLLEK